MDPHPHRRRRPGDHPRAGSRRLRRWGLRSVAELRAVEDSAWDGIERTLDASAGVAFALPVDAVAAEECLYRLQVSTRSALGALALHSGGIVVDKGWLRLLGGGHHPLPDLATANGLGTPTAVRAPPGFLQVPRDVLGGLFAISGGVLPGRSGEICYLGADTLAWEPLDLGHGDFVAWALGCGTRDFYADLRWDGWEDETASLALDQGLSFYPPLFSAEGRNSARTSRRPVLWDELFAFNQEMRVQLRNVAPDERFRINPSD